MLNKYKNQIVDDFSSIETYIKSASETVREMQSIRTVREESDFILQWMSFIDIVNRNEDRV